MNSLWKKTAEQPTFIPLNKDIHTDVLIIGGGIAGLLLAYSLHSSGTDYVLLEARAVCSGTTKNTTAKITSQHGLIYAKLIREFGTEKARQYLNANEDAVCQYRALCSNIDCDFADNDAYVYSLDDRAAIHDEIDALATLGYDAEFVRDLPLPFPVAGAVKFTHQAQFDPLKFTAAISNGLHIFEHSEVKELVGKKAVTEHGSVSANKIVVATHFPFINKHGMYFLKMYQHRSYVIALQGAPDLNGMYVDKDKAGLSFRNYGDLLLIGGGAHRTGKTGGSFRELRNFAKSYYPDAVEKYYWATQDCMTLDSAPYIGRYSMCTHDLYVATGFNKWGMTSSMAASNILSDAVCGKKNQYADVFSPSRSMLRPQLALNAFEAVCGLLTPSEKRCPHLGCALKWNASEHTWDCPCHGSRFTGDGRLIDNPATGDLEK